VPVRRLRSRIEWVTTVMAAGQGAMKLTYWLSTSLVSLLLLLSAWSYLLHDSTIDGIRALGFPDFFRVELAVLKILAAVVLIVPLAPPLLKEWAYAGVGLFLITAIVAHTAHKDPLLISLFNGLMLLVLGTSNVAMHRLAEIPAP